MNTFETIAVHPMNTLTSVPSTTRALIDLAAFRHNLGVIRSYLAPGTKIVAVVKAHAYGHGLRVIAFEAERCGVDYLGVARADEGIELRNAGIRTPILVFEVVSPVYYETAIRQHLELTVSTVEGGWEAVWKEWRRRRDGGGEG